ncbi:hypothetical protein KAR91_50530 [Candidatus Pacearchaeota archaeon]|nr:hypothetical protein [Candidatus Pacearchaeota archaeon]
MEIILKSDDGREVKFQKTIGFGAGLTESLLMERLINNQMTIQEGLENSNVIIELLNRLSQKKND